MNSKMSKISIKSFHYNPLTFSVVSSEKHMCPVFFRVIFTCFLNNRFCSEGRGKETGGVLLSCLIFFFGLSKLPVTALRNTDFLAFFNYTPPI